MDHLKQLSLATALTILSAAHLQAQQYNIKGTIKGISNGKIKLQRYNSSDRTYTAIDSTTIRNGTFALKGSLETPEMVSLLVEPGNWGFSAFIENKPITITADTLGSRHYDYTAYGMGKGAQIQKVQVKGSASQDDWNAYENNPTIKNWKKQLEDLSNKYYATKEEAQKNSLRAKIDSIGDLMKKRQFDDLQKYIAAKPTAVAGAYMFSQYYTFNTEMELGKMESILNQFKGEAAQSTYAKELFTVLDSRKALLPGKPAPDFTLLQRDSTKRSLSSLKGKYIMIDFWASWCVPCRKAIPHWKEIYQKYHDKGFDIISVSDDSRWNDWIKAMDIEKMPWNQVVDEFPIKNMPAKVGTLYQTHFIPFYVLLDKEGNILVYSGEEKDIDQKLEEIFKS